MAVQTLLQTLLVQVVACSEGPGGGTGGEEGRGVSQVAIKYMDIIVYLYSLETASTYRYKTDQ